MAEFWENDPAETSQPVAAGGDFWAQDAVDRPAEANLARGTNLDAPVKPVERTQSKFGQVVDALKDPEFWSEVGTSAKDLKRRVDRAPGAMLDVAGAQLKGAAAGMSRFMADIDEGMAVSAAETYKRSNAMSMAERREAVKQKDIQAGDAALRQIGADRATRRAAAQAEAAIPTDAGSIERNIIQGGGSAMAMAPIVAAGAVAPGAQAPALVAMSTIAGAGRYGALREKDIEKNKAAVSSLLLGGLEGLTEAFPLGALAKRTPFVRQATEFLVTDLLGENVSSLAQLADDFNLGLRDDVTIQDIKDTIADTSIATIAGSSIQVGAAKVLGAIADKANQRAAERAGPSDIELEEAADFARSGIIETPAAPKLLTGPAAEADFEVGPEGVARRPGEEVPKPKALPAPRGSGEFVAGEEGVRELNEGEKFAADQQRQELAEKAENLGTAPLRVPVTPSERRAAMADKHNALLDAVKKVTDPKQVDIRATKEGYAVRVGGVPQAEYTSFELAKRERDAIKAVVGVNNKTEIVNPPAKATGNGTHIAKIAKESPDRDSAWSSLSEKAKNAIGEWIAGGRNLKKMRDAAKSLWEGDGTNELAPVLDEIYKNGEAGRRELADQANSDGTVTLLRGLRKGKGDDEQSQQIESLTTDPVIAKQFAGDGGVVQRVKVRVEDIVYVYGESESEVLVRRPAKATEKPAAATAPEKVRVLGQEIDRPATPTERQALAGNYRKPIVYWNEMPIRIENDKGSIRTGPVDEKTGKPAWQTKQQAHYGYIQGSTSADKEGVDVYIGDDDQAADAYVIDQLTPDGQKFDEPKIVVGVKSEAEARALYLKHYPKGWKGLGAITKMSAEDVGEWAYSDAPKEPTSWMPPAKRAQSERAAEFVPKKTVLERMATEAGWMQEGGKAITDEDATNPKVVGRTKWLPREPWFQEVQQVAPLAGNKAGTATREAVRKALAGDRLNAAEKRHINAMIAADKNRMDEEKKWEDMQKVTDHDLDARLAELNKRLESAEKAEPKGDDVPAFQRTKKPDSQPDMFGDPVAIKNELKRLEAEKDRRRNSGRESADIGKTDDLFSQASKQMDIEDKKPAQPVKKESALEAALRDAGIDPNAPVDEVKQLRRDAEKLQKEARQMLSGIEPGQPIMSARDKNLREKSAEKTRKAGELFDRADKIERDKAKATPEPPPDPIQSGVMTLESHKELFKKLRDGNVTLAEYKAGWTALLASRSEIHEELEDMKKDELEKIITSFIRPGSKKADLVESAEQSLLSRFALEESIVIPMTFTRDPYKSYVAAIGKIVDATDQAKLDAYAARVKANTEAHLERLKGMDDPKTLDDFKRFISRKGEAALSDEQIEKFDELMADESQRILKEAKERRERERATIRPAGQTVGAKVIDFKHTKHGYPIYVVQMDERVERDVYNTLNASAKQLGGYYSSYRGGGAIPGFTFKERDKAEAFAQLLQTGDTTVATEVAATRRDEYQDDKAQATADRLRSMADRLEASAEERLNVDRKTNTSRRANMAARADAEARSDMAFALTMRNIANAMDNDQAKYLEGLRTKAQIEMMAGFLRRAKHNEALIKAKEDGYTSESKRLEWLDKEPTSATARHVEYPYFWIRSGDLSSLARELVEIDGAKLLGQRILKHTDDMTTDYTKFVKENLHTVALRLTSGELALFDSYERAERARKNSPAPQKMATISLGRGKNYVVLSPREAMARKLWEGPPEKRIKLQQDIAEEIMDKINAYNRTAQRKVSYPWIFDNAKEERTRLKAMGIENPSMLRAAVREYIQLRKQPTKEDPIKKLMRALVGNKSVGIDFFPTPPEEAAGLVSKADIQSGMDVLEPSAGYGAIADEIRGVGTEPDVVEMSSTLREILEAKGYNVVAQDFMDYSGKLYDRIVMNPPFSKGMDIDHVRHAYDLLKPGGRVVAIMGEGAFFRSDAKATQFREWADSLGAVDEQLPEGTFLDPSLPVNTGVNARVIVIDKPVGEANASAYFLRSGTRTKGQPVDSVRAAVNTILSRFKVKPALHVVENFNDFDKPMLDVLAKSSVQDGDITAFYYKGGVYVIADQVKSMDSLADTIIHEYVVHFGLRSAMPQGEYLDILDGIAKDMRMEVRRRGRLEYGDAWDETNDFQRTRAAEEMIAYYAPEYLRGQSIPERMKRWVERFITAVRDWVREVLGMPQLYDQAFIKKLLVDLETHLKSGESINQKATEEPAFVSKQPTWFSALTRAAETAKREKGTGKEWLNTLRNMPGVKAEEIEATDLEQFLGDRIKISKQEVVDYLNLNGVQVTETVLGIENDETGANLPDGWIVTRAGNHYEVISQNGEGRTRGTGSTEQEAIEDALGAFPHMKTSVETKFAQYTLPGGQNYRELLLTLPTKAQRLAAMNGRPWSEMGAMERYDYAEAAGEDARPFTSSHWSEPNVIAHIRFDERVDADGKRVMHIAEVQSDWHQAGRKKGYKSELKKRIAVSAVHFKAGFWEVRDQNGEFVTNVHDYALPDADEAKAIEVANARIAADEIGQVASSRLVPDAPFKTTWPELAMKRAIRWASENGIDRITWDTGSTNAERYDLSKQVDSIKWNETTLNGASKIVEMKITGQNSLRMLIDKDGVVMSANGPGFSQIEGKGLDDAVGKDMANKIMSEDTGDLSGDGLRVGGTGMIGFYDRILPATVGKLIKKWGSKVSSAYINDRTKQLAAEQIYGRGTDYESLPPMTRDTVDRVVEQNSIPVHGFDLTDSMKSAAMQGLPMFQRTAQSMGRVLPKKTPQNSPQWEWKGYQDIANKVIASWNDKIGWRWGALGKLPDQDLYLKARYRTLGNIHEVRVVARHIFDSLKHATTEDAAAVFDYMTTRDARPDNIADEKVKGSAIQAKLLIAEQGQRLFDAGLLSDEAMERYSGEYLPRMYLKHVLGDQMFGEMGAGMRLSKQGNLKMRKDIPEEVRKFVLGEITDPAFLASFSVSRVGRDLAMMDFLNLVSKNQSWVPETMLVQWNGKNVSPYWVRTEAARLRKQATFVKDHPTAGTMRNIADRMDALADRAVERLEGVPLEDFKQIPDAARYGALRGLWVRKEIYEDLVGAQAFIDPKSFEALMDRTAGKVTRWFKFSKVAANLPSHFRNLYGNAMMMHLSGVPMRRVFSGEIFLKSLDSIINKDRFWQLANRYGLQEASFANVELARIRDEWMAMQESDAMHSGPAKLKAMFGRVTNAIGDLYQFEEALGKIAKMRDAIEREGMEESDAVLEAHKWLFDYSLVPRWVRYMRNAPLGVPFLTYTYKAMPRMAETLVRTPWRFLPYIAIGYGVEELFKYFWDVDDEDAEKARKAAPSWMENRGSLMMLPFKDDVGRLQMFDMGYITPWGMLADLGAQAGSENYGSMLSTTGLMGGPLPDIVTAVNTGIDPFTGKKIMPDGATPKEKAGAVLTYAWNFAMPGMFTSTGWAGKVHDLYTGKVNKYTGDTLLTPAQTWSRLFGLTVYPYDPEESRQLNIRFMHRDIEDVQDRLRTNLRDVNLENNPEKAEQLRQDAEELMNRRQQELQLYEQESEVPENLQREKTEHKPFSDLIGQLEPFIQNKDRAGLVKELKRTGNPALASLVEEMPRRPRPVVASALQQFGAQA